MRTEQLEFTGDQGRKLPGILWLPEESPKMVLQVAHGMTEHMGRYTALARELTGLGIVVAGFDLRGHGRNPGDRSCASFGEKGWEATLGDMRCFFEVLSHRFPGVPLAMLGFSLGSFLVREYLGRYPDGVTCAAILGTGDQPGPVLSIMMAVVKGQIRKAGFDNTTDLVKKLSFENYNRKFAPNRTPSDWLCADNAQLDAYRSDPLCRENISAGLFWELMGAMKRTGSKTAYAHWNRKMPVLLLSGLNDPVGDFGKGVERVHQGMEKAGFADVTVYLLPDARHDLLHEEESGAAVAARRTLGQWLLKQV